MGESALTSLRRILRVVDTHSRELARTASLTASRLVVLKILANGPTTAGTIAERAGISQTTVTLLLNKLEAMALVRRQRSEDDRRRVWVELTPQGRAAIDKAPDLLQDVFLQRFRKLPSWEQHGIAASLSRITYLLDADALDAAPLLDVGPIDRAAT
ncbi:MAG: MarR family transcriptional regulator [Pseudomonadales bacterium]|nr:MarR family transcriptional regulator [Pseudomonadales bacterium]MCP5185604.1 MarR family transcriptional regulator [Pseudomonadales bacterium]